MIKVNTPLTDDIVYCERSGVFQDYRVGDKIGYYDTVALGGAVWVIGSDDLSLVKKRKYIISVINIKGNYIVINI